MDYYAHDDSSFREIFRSVHAKWLKSSNCEQKLKIVITENKPNRSLSQNSLFHVWVAQVTKWLNVNRMCMQGSYSEAMVKDYLKRKYGIMEDLPQPFGESMETVTVSTTQYSVEFFNEFLTKIQVMAIEEGINLSVQACKVFDEYKESQK